MSKQDIYFQCKMRQGDEIIVGWIEARGARVGAMVEVKDKGGFWEVLAVPDTGVAKQVLSEMNATKRKGFKSIERE